MQAIGSALDNADLVVQALDKAQGDLIFGFAVSGNACPLPFDERCKLLIGFKALPLQLRLPVLEELPRPGFAGVVPQLREGFLEQIGGVQALVGGKQELQILASRAFEVLRMREQRIFLPLDERAILAAQSRVLKLAHLVERLAEVSDDVKLVEQNRCLRGVLSSRVAKRLPHVDGDLNPRDSGERRGLTTGAPVVD